MSSHNVSYVSTVILALNFKKTWQLSLTAKPKPPMPSPAKKYPETRTSIYLPSPLYVTLTSPLAGTRLALQKTLWQSAATTWSWCQKPPPSFLDEHV